MCIFIQIIDIHTADFANNVLREMSMWRDIEMMQETKVSPLPDCEVHASFVLPNSAKNDSFLTHATSFSQLFGDVTIPGVFTSILACILTL